jgi:two-component system chemotaxis sensor kinase CheA
VHELESSFLETGFSKEPLEALKRHWETLGETVERAVGRSAKEALVVPRKEYDRLLRLMQTEGRSQDAFEMAQSWSMHRVGNSLSRLAKTAVRYAERQGKQVNVAIEGGDLAVRKGMLDEFWGCLIHLVKNAVAHGIEGSDSRVEAGKAAEGTIALAARVEHGDLLVTVGDDGRGIDWKALEAKAGDGRRGLELLSSGSGVSTAAEADDLSGRGVGVGAVVQVVKALGGEFNVDSSIGHGTRFTVKLPVANDAYVPTPSLAPPAAEKASGAKG